MRNILCICTADAGRITGKSRESAKSGTDKATRTGWQRAKGTQKMEANKVMVAARMMMMMMTKLDL